MQSNRRTRVQDWFDEVRDVWNRLASLYRFDAQLTAGNGSIRVGRRRCTIGSHRPTRCPPQKLRWGWWTTDGWKAFVEDTTTGLGTELQRSWEAYLDQQGISEFVERIADHPWVIPATELPTGVQVAMEHEYITPLRELRRWYETVDGAIASLSSDDEDALLSAADDFADVEPLSETVEYDVDELEGDSTDSPKSFGDRGPDEIDQIGVLPDDRQNIDRRLERLVESRESWTSKRRTRGDYPMTDSPYRAFKEKLCTFADGQAGIRNPFVIAGRRTRYPEHRTVDRPTQLGDGVR